MNFEFQLNDLIATAERFRAVLPQVAAAGEALGNALRQGHKLLTAGNGGSASDALHLAEELVGRFDQDRPSLAAVCLCADPTAITCIANDYGYERVFARQVEGLGRPGDVLVIFTTSGNSPNLIAALQTAKARGMVTVAVLGKSGGAAKGLADHEIIVPSMVGARIQELHTFILHCWLTQIEAGLQADGGRGTDDR